VDEEDRENVLTQRIIHENVEGARGAQNGGRTTHSNGCRPWFVFAINLLFNLMSRIGPRSGGR
jgi:hypothetical protein